LPRQPTLISVEGLRSSDATSLSVITQDLFNQNLVRLAAQTLADLFALSELRDQLPPHMLRDLDAFAKQKVRELRDLPDGPPLAQLLERLEQVPPEAVPARLRRAVLDLAEPQRQCQEAREALDRLSEGWDGVEPEEIRVRNRSVQAIQRPAVPKRLQVPDDSKPRKRAQARKKPSGTPAPTPAARQDQERASWIRQDVLERLDTHGERGLKESVLVAGTRRRSPFPNMLGAEVLAELRQLKKTNEVRNSAGRWIRVKRLGW